MTDIKKINFPFDGIRRGDHLSLRDNQVASGLG